VYCKIFLIFTRSLLKTICMFLQQRPHTLVCRVSSHFLLKNWDQTQGLVHAKQVLHHWVTSLALPHLLIAGLCESTVMFTHWGNHLVTHLSKITSQWSDTGLYLAQLQRVLQARSGLERVTLQLSALTSSLHAYNSLARMDHVSPSALLLCIQKDRRTGSLWVAVQAVTNWICRFI
jgi:hypothetical protein